MISLQFLWKTAFATSLCLALFSNSMTYAAQTETAKFQNSKYEVRIVKLPSEHETGLREYIYEDGSTKTEEMPATGHIWSEWIVDVEPTYTKEGHMYRVCEKIPGKPHFEERTIPKLMPGEEYGDEIADEVKPQTNSGDIESPNITNVESETQSLKIVQNIITDHISKEETVVVVQEPLAKAKGMHAAFNTVDAIFIAGILLAFAFSYFYILPLLAVLVWARKKRRKILGE